MASDASIARANETTSVEKIFSTDHIKIKGDAEQIAAVKKYFPLVGLPLNNIKNIVFRTQEQLNGWGKKHPNDLITEAIHDHNSNTIQLRDDFFLRYPEYIVPILAHELAHSLTPAKMFRKKNEWLFGSAKERMEVLSFVKTILKQLKKADEFLSVYHQDIEYKRKKFWGRIKNFMLNTRYEEAWAILVEMRLTNPHILEYVQNKIFFEHENRIWPGKKPIAIMTPTGSSEPVGIDLILIKLMSPQIKNLSELNAHCANLDSIMHPPRSRKRKR